MVDVNGNVVDDNSNVAIMISTNPSSGTLSGSLSVPAVHGIATFSDLKIDTVGQGYKLSAADGSLGGATSGSFDIVVGVVHHLVFGVQPSDSGAGQSIPTFTVKVVDVAGNVVPTDNSSVTLTIGANPGAAPSAEPRRSPRSTASRPSATSRSTRSARATR